MVTDFNVLQQEEPIGRAVELLLAGAQQDFPVVEAGRVVGALSRKDLFAELARHGPGATVGSVMTPQVLTLETEDPLDLGAEKLQQAEQSFAVVLAAGHLRGLLTLENVGEFVVIQQALAAGRHVPPLIAPPLR
jgi:CBS domain-containing protein